MSLHGKKRKTIGAALLAAACIAAAGCLIGGRARESGMAISGHLDELARHAWKNIGSSKSLCGDFDYFPNGGMRNFYCHSINFCDFPTFRKMIGVPIFRKGPHGPGGLVLDAPDSFGHYNPEFVVRLRRALLPGAADAAFQSATQDVYDAFVAPLARIFFVTRRKLMMNPAYLEQETRAYLVLVNAGTLPRWYYEKYFYFMNPSFVDRENDQDYLMSNGFDGGWDGNMVKTCVAFWIRRSIDGTSDEFNEGLELLLKTYDGDFLLGGAMAEPVLERNIQGR